MAVRKLRGAETPEQDTELLCARMERILLRYPTLPPASEWVAHPALRTILGVAWQHRRIQRPSFVGVDLRIDLTHADLYGISFHECRISLCRDSRLAGCSFVDCDLERADLSGADLSGAVLHGCNLGGATLDRARLYGSEMSWCDLRDIDLPTAHIAGLDISSCKGHADRDGRLG